MKGIFSIYAGELVLVLVAKPIVGALASMRRTEAIISEWSL